MLLRTLVIDGAELARATFGRLRTAAPLQITQTQRGASLSMDTGGLLIQARVTAVHRAPSAPQGANDPIYPQDVTYTVQSVTLIGGAQVIIPQQRPVLSPFAGDGAAIYAAPVGALAYIQRVITGQGPLGIQYAVTHVQGERQAWGACSP